MGGLLKGLMSAAEVAGGVALEFVPGGQLAGAMLITAGIGSSGLIGGSVGKFLNSGVGQGLMGAMAMGAGAVYSYGMDAAQAAAGAQAATAATAGSISANAATDAQAAVTSTDALNSTQVSSDISQIASQDPGSFLGASGTDPASVSSAYPPGTPAAPTGPGAAAAQTSAANTAVDANATKATGAAGQNLIGSQAPANTTPTGGPGAAPSPLVGNTQLAGGGMGPQNAAPGGYTPNVNGPPGLNPSTTDMSEAQPQGMLGKAAAYIGKNPGVAVAGGQALSGLAQGAAAEKTMQEQLAAAQWGNLQWQNPAEVSQLQSAAAQPVTVPQGYLQRAAAVKGMMGATPSAPVGGVQPMAIAGAAPGAPLAPKLPGQA